MVNETYSQSRPMSSTVDGIVVFDEDPPQDAIAAANGRSPRSWIRQPAHPRVRAPFRATKADEQALVFH
jgi:hypothetical protein